jgi:hypothetical protein
MTIHSEKINVPAASFTGSGNRFGRVLGTGLFAGLIMLGVSVALTPLFTAINPLLQKEYENTLIFRTYKDPVMWLFFSEPFLVGLILAWIWDKTRFLFGTTTNIREGIRFALLYWITTLPGMLLAYSTFQLSFGMILSWSASIFIQSIFASIFVVKMLR